MSKNRIKVELKQIASRADAEGVMNELATATNAKRKLQAQLDARVLNLKSECERSFAFLDKEIGTHTDALRAWAESNPEEFPKGRKSLELLAGVLGFRTGTPKLALLNRSWTWVKVLATLKALPWGKNYVRTIEEVDKDGLLASRSVNPDKAVADICLNSVGTKMVQDESFFVEPKLTETETRQTVAA